MEQGSSEVCKADDTVPAAALRSTARAHWYALLLYCLTLALAGGITEWLLSVAGYDADPDFLSARFGVFLASLVGILMLLLWVLKWLSRILPQAVQDELAKYTSNK